MDNLTKALLKKAAHQRAALFLQKCLIEAGVYANLEHSGNNYVVRGIDWEARIGFSAGNLDSGIFEVQGCITRDEDPDAVYQLNLATILFLAENYFNEDEDDFDEEEDDFEDEEDYEDDYYDEDEDEDDDEDIRVCLRPRPQTWQRWQRRQRPQRQQRQEDGNSDQYAALEKAGEDLIQDLKDVIGNKYKADADGDPAVFEARRAQILDDVVEVLRVSRYLKGGMM